MIQVQVNAEDLEKLIGRLGHLPNDFLQDVVTRTVPELQERAPKATSNLARSARPRVVDGEGEILFDTNYAGFVHDGRGAGGVDFEGIADWVKVKGLPDEAAFPIAQSIKNKGIKSNPWVSDFVQSVEMRNVVQAAFMGALRHVVG